MLQRGKSGGKTTVDDLEAQYGCELIKMATFQVTPPDRFSFKPEEWSKWIRRFERFRLVSELNKKDEASQVNTFIYSMGDEADDILQSFGMSADDKKSSTQ